MMIWMNAKTTAWVIFGITVIASLFLWYFADPFADWSKVGDPLLVAIAYLIANISYPVLLVIFTKQKGIRGFVGGLLLIIAIDILSWSHSIRMSGALPTDAALYSYIDTILYRTFPNFPLGTFGLYVILADFMVFAALEIAGYVSFIAMFKKVTGVGG